MKLSKIAAAVVIAALAVSMTACGAASSTAASSEVASSVAASSEAASSEAEQLVANYVLRNDTGAELSEVYFFVTDTEDKGENLVADGALAADGTLEVSYERASGETPVFTVEYVTADGGNYQFTTLNFENATVGLQVVDGIGSATVGM